MYSWEGPHKFEVESQDSNDKIIERPFLVALLSHSDLYPEAGTGRFDPEILV